MVERSDYGERFAALMKDRSLTVRDMADALDISYQAVKKIVDGKSGMLASDNNARAAAIFHVDPDWLATGEGKKERGAADFSTDAMEIAAIFDATNAQGRAVLRATAHALIVEPPTPAVTVEPAQPPAAPKPPRTPAK